MGVAIETGGGPNAVDVWTLAKGDIATVITPATIRGHTIFMSAYGPVDFNDLNATFVQPFAMNVLKWAAGSVTMTVT